MKKIDFLFMYEHPERELECILLLGIMLKRKGCTVRYYQLPADYRYNTKRYFGKVDTVVVPYMYNNNNLFDIVFRIAGRVNHIFNMQWEQILTVHNEANPNVFWFPKENAVKAKHLCWGTKTFENMTTNGIEKDNAFVGGALQIDLLDKCFRDTFPARDDMLKKHSVSTGAKNRIILFVSSFSNVNIDEDRLVHMNKVMGEGGYDEFRKCSAQSQKGIIKWLSLINDEGYTVIYRPHPSETLSQTVREAEKAGKIYVIGDGAVSRWINISDYVFTWISTSFTESYFMGKGCGILRPVALPEDREMCIFRGVTNITSYDEMKKYVEQNEPLKRNEIIESYFYRGKEPAYERISQYLYALHEGKHGMYDWDDNEVKQYITRRKHELHHLTKDRVKYIICFILVKTRLCFINESLKKRAFRKYTEINALRKKQKIRVDNIMNKRIREHEIRIDGII